MTHSTLDYTGMENAAKNSLIQDLQMRQLSLYTKGCSVLLLYKNAILRSSQKS